MKANELMIDDWVWYNNQPHQIRQLGIFGENRDGDDYPAVCVGKPNGVGLILERNEIEPIPLTPEILEKNGFTGGKYENYCGNVFYLSVDGFREAGLTMSYKDNILWCERIKQNYPNSIGDKYAIHHLEYVHQLQHALRLCGIKKEIEL